MDPNVALVEIRALARQLLDPEQIDAAEHAQQLGEELAQKILDLDEWIGMRGFLPDAWE